MTFLAEKGNLLSPLQVIEIVSRSKNLTVGDVRNYFLSILNTGSKIIDEENALITKYQHDTERIRQHIEKMKNRWDLGVYNVVPIY